MNPDFFNRRKPIALMIVVITLVFFAGPLSYREAQPQPQPEPLRKYEVTECDGRQTVITDLTFHLKGRGLLTSTRWLPLVRGNETVKAPRNSIRLLERDACERTWKAEFNTGSAKSGFRIGFPGDMDPRSALYGRDYGVVSGKLGLSGEAEIDIPMHQVVRIRMIG